MGQERKQSSAQHDVTSHLRFIHIDYGRKIDKRSNTLDSSEEHHPLQARLMTSLLEQQYSAISSILGITTFPEHYRFLLTELDDDTMGIHYHNFSHPEKSYIIIALSEFKKVYQNHIPADRNVLARLFFAHDSQSFVDGVSIVRLVGTLAHELYHKRQALVFPHSYKGRLAHYVDSAQSKTVYTQQLLEQGANIFENEYMRHLIRNQQHCGNRMLRQSIKYYVEFERQYKLKYGNYFCSYLQE